MSDVIPRLSPTNKVHSTDEIPPSKTAWSPPPSKPTDLSVIAFLVTVLFSHIFGFFAYHFTISAKHSWQLHDYTRSKRHAKYATTLAVLGIIVGLTTYAVAFSLYFTLKVDTSCPIATTSGSTHFANQPNTTVITTIGRIVPTTTTDTTRCCLYCPFLGEGRNSFIMIEPTEPTCSVFCTSTGNGPIYPDPNGTYNDCCNELGCQSLPSK